MGDPQGSLPNLDVEIHGKRPGAHQPCHEVALPVGELGMDGCETEDSWLHADNTPTDRGRQSLLFCLFWPATTSSYRKNWVPSPGAATQPLSQRRQVGSVRAQPKTDDGPSPKGPAETSTGSLLINSLRGGTRILLLMAHQPMGWTSTVPRLHQKSWLASFSKPSYRSSTRYPGRGRSTGEGRWAGEDMRIPTGLPPSPAHPDPPLPTPERLPGTGGSAVPQSHGQDKPMPLTRKAAWHSAENQLSIA